MTDIKTEVDKLIERFDEATLTLDDAAELHFDVVKTLRAHETRLLFRDATIQSQEQEIELLKAAQGGCKCFCGWYDYARGHKLNNRQALSKDQTEGGE